MKPCKKCGAQITGKIGDDDLCVQCQRHNSSQLFDNDYGWAHPYVGKVCVFYEFIGVTNWTLPYGANGPGENFDPLLACICLDGNGELLTRELVDPKFLVPRDQDHPESQRFIQRILITLTRVLSGNMRIIFEDDALVKKVE